MYMISLITLVEVLILESFLGNVETSDGDTIGVEFTKHSLIGHSESTSLGRIGLDTIFDSIKDNIDIIHQIAILIIPNCQDKTCSLIVRDNLYNMDYHLWLRKTNNNKLILTINTSIHHPKKLFNKEKSKIININYDETFNILEIYQIIKNKPHLIKEVKL